MKRPPSTHTRAALSLFLLSGATGLVYQVVWVRHFVHVFGATVLAVSTVLSAFMGGLALGGLAGGRLATRVRNPLRMYGVLELALAVYAALVPAILHAVHPLYAGTYQSLEGSFWALSAVRFLVSVLVLLPPTFLMGATLPLLAAHAEGAAAGRDPGWVRRRIAWLYAINTFGAVGGTAAASFLLLPAFGLARTLWIGVAVNLLVAALALLLSRGAPGPAAAAETDEAPDAAPTPIAGRIVLVAAGVLGFSALALEVLWTRTLTLALGTTTYAFALVLTAFLLGIAAGSAVATRLLRRPGGAAGAFALAPAVIGFLALALIPLFDRLPDLFVYLTARGNGTWEEGLAVKFAIAAIPMLLPTLVSGAAFPLAVGLYRASGRAGRSVGDVYAANTFGAILGSWAAGFLLIRFLGMRNGIAFAAAVQVAMSVVLLLGWRGAGAALRRGAAAALVAATALVVLTLPDWDRAALTRGGFAIAVELRRFGLSELAVDRSEIVFFEEGLTTTVTVRRWGDELTMQMNGVTEASNRGDLATQTLVGALPTLLHPDPRDLLVIGLGSGITTAAAARHPGVESVDCVEISESVVHAAAFFREANHGILEDPRLRSIVGDGRNHLQLSGRKFDIIVSQPSNVWVSGTSALMTSEFFGMCREGLRPGGLLCTWIQGYSLSSEALRSVLAAVREHFPRVTLWSAGWGDLAIVAGDESFAIDLQGILDKAARHSEVREVLRDADMPDLVSLVSRNLMAGDALDRFIGDAAPNTDDNLHLEFVAPRLLYRETIRELFESIHAAAGGTEELLVNAPDGFRQTLPRLRRARDLESEGRLLFREGRGDEGLRLMEEAHALHPTDPAIADILARALNGRGETLARRRDGAAALEQYRRAAEIDPEFAEPLANAARLYRDASTLEPAAAMVEGALQRRPDHPEFLCLRSEIRRLAHDLPGARADAQRALDVDPNYLDGFLALGAALQAAGEFDRSDSVYAAALARHPESAELREAREAAAVAGRKALRAD